MLRAIFFLDCDYCHEPHSRLLTRTDKDDTDWISAEGYLEETAYEDGWCHCLNEDTGRYLLMCGACHVECSLLTKQAAHSADF